MRRDSHPAFPLFIPLRASRTSTGAPMSDPSQTLAESRRFREKMNAAILAESHDGFSVALVVELRS